MAGFKVSCLTCFHEVGTVFFSFKRLRAGFSRQIFTTCVLHVRWYFRSTRSLIYTPPMREPPRQRKARLKRWKRVVAGITLVLPFIYLSFVISDRMGVWDKVTGLDLVEKASRRFDLSYAQNASQPVRVGDREWEPLLALAYRYSVVNFPKDREPHVFVRLVAPFSSRTPEQGDIAAEWTVPSTPLFLLYQDWPQNSGKGVPPENVRMIGTIGDLRDWISREKDRRKFLVQDIFLGTFGPLLAIVIFWLEKRIEE